MAVRLQRIGIETRAVVGHFDDDRAGEAGYRHPLIAGAAVAKAIGQRFLQHAEQRNSHLQRGCVRGVVERERHRDAGLALMVSGCALQGLDQ